MRESISLDEQETILNIVPTQISDRIHVYTCISADIRYYKKLAADHPAEVVITRCDNSGVEIEIPSTWFRRPKKPNRRQMNEEQRAETAARLATARKNTKGGACHDLRTKEETVDPA